MEQDRDNIAYWTEEANLEWYTRQFDNPYKITIEFEKFLSSKVDIDNLDILDVGCGPGGGTHYIAKKHASTRFTGIDINTKLFDLYKGVAKNIRFEYGDIYNINQNYMNQYQGIICLQTLSWLPDYRKPLEQMCKLNAEWIAFSALLYDGMINYTISLENYERPTHNSDFSQVYYNIYSVPKLAEEFKKYGYEHVYYQPFEIDIDISKPEHRNLGYYTVQTIEGKRLAFNTCLYQPEGFIFASRK